MLGQPSDHSVTPALTTPALQDLTFLSLCLQEEQDRLAAERRRQAELARLRREKRQAERESKFDEAALVLGLAERNRLNLEEK